MGKELKSQTDIVKDQHKLLKEPKSGVIGNNREVDDNNREENKIVQSADLNILCWVKN